MKIKVKEKVFLLFILNNNFSCVPATCQQLCVCVCGLWYAYAMAYASLCMFVFVFTHSGTQVFNGCGENDKAEKAQVPLQHWKDTFGPVYVPFVFYDFDKKNIEKKT